MISERIIQEQDLNDSDLAYSISIVFQDKNLPTELNWMTVPVSVIVRNDDLNCNLVSPASRIRGNITGSKLVDFNNCGHMPWIEQPAEFYSHGRVWFEEQQLKKFEIVVAAS